MRIRASFMTLVELAVVAGLATGAGCSHASAKLMVDAPKMLPYQAPDIDEITGIDSSDTDEAAPSNGATAPRK
jgi:uncharacterized lipoprotein YajG